MEEDTLIGNSLKTNQVSRALIEIVWQFGPKGLDGECCEDLSMPEYLALEAASLTADCPVQHIGARLGFTKSGATRIVNRLEKKGYIQKLRSSEDARICCVVPTEKGEQILANVSQYYIDRLKTVLDKTPEGQSELIKNALITMAEALRR
ncbi:MarR family winged helix-turn-helix transcriptional regulator [Desulfosediminicola sp.]|uniref:MarR family winged helix-turn-helix transcriptional regulator n=1 Tax=Desulfosediminicola sp. TaxID=2886825 RepID=UPI003AF20341